MLATFITRTASIAMDSMTDQATPAVPEQPVRLPLKQLGLRAGMALQTRRLVEGTSKKESQYIGAIESKGVMVGPIGSDAEQTGLTAGEVCIVRGFTGQYEFSFLSKVLQTFEKPFVYALLAYPALVDARLVRQSLRVKMSWPTQITVPGQSAVDATLVDLSTAGAMVTTAQVLGSVGEMLVLELGLQVDETPIALQLNAKVCHSNRLASSNTVCTGLAFVGATAQDKMALSYVTQSSINANAA